MVLDSLNVIVRVYHALPLPGSGEIGGHVML